MSDEEHHVCSFCLGDDTEVPPFGNVKDAQDLIRPCTTCSIVTHRKCLLDWFNSLPSKDLYVIDSSNLEELELIRTNINTSNQNEVSIEALINITPNSLNQLVSNIASGIWSVSGPSYSDANASDKHIKFLLVDCPQCKQNIVFRMKRNNALSLYKALRVTTTRFVQYGIASLGVGSAIAGMVSMGYVGLTSCGLKMMDCLIPESLLIQMLSKRSNSPVASNSLSKLILGNVRNYAIDNLEQALVKGLIDPLKFSRIPILPIVLYRMRSSSWLSCLFTDSKDISLYNWVTEFIISGYISSLGNHKLLKILHFNMQILLRALITNPSKLASQSLSLERINFWDINNMMSMLVPLRWIYDLFFRLTINRIHFNQAMKIRPREVSNSLNSREVDYIEALSSEVVREEMRYNNIKATVDKLVDMEFDKKTNIPVISIIRKHISKRILLQKACSGKCPTLFSKSKLMLWVHQGMACLKNDYSTTFLSNSASIRAITTILWPYLSSKVGNVIFNLLLKDAKLFNNIPSNKVLLLSNIIGLVAATFLKDLANVYVSSKKVKELSQMSVVCVEPLTSNGENDNDVQEFHEVNIPGGFQN